MIEVLASVLVASLVGSLHCAGMCGSIVGLYSMSSRGVRPHAAYHLSRGASYVLLGIAAGALGAMLDLAGRAAGLSRVAGMAAGAAIVVFGCAQLLYSFRQPSPPGPSRSAPSSSSTSTSTSTRPPDGSWGLLRWMRRVLRPPTQLFGRVLARVMERPVTSRASLLGFASALLPCGWLYAFVMSAAGTGSPVLGGAVMLAFWLGTIPALIGAGLGISQLSRWLGRRAVVVMSVLLVTVGLLTMVQRGRLLGGAACPHCRSQAGPNDAH